MHTVELLEEGISLAQRLGYRIRQEWLGGDGGGACEVKGRKCFFLDLALGPVDQLDHLLVALRGEPGVHNQPMSHYLRELLELRKCA